LSSFSSLHGSRIASIIHSLHVFDRSGIYRPDEDIGRTISTTKIDNSAVVIESSKVHYHTLHSLSDASSSRVRNLILESRLSNKSNNENHDQSDVIIHRYQMKIELVEQLQCYLHNNIINYILSNHLYSIMD